MNHVPRLFKLDGKTYDLEGASPDVAEFVRRIRDLDQLFEEKRNLLALLTKAKNAYIRDIKHEIVSNKLGEDLSSLLD